MSEIAQQQLPPATTVGRDIAWNDAFSASYATYAANATFLLEMLSANSIAVLLNDGAGPAQEWSVAAYSTTFIQPTFISFRESLDSPEDSDIQEFAQEIASIYATLAENQEPLGKEFADVWDANIRRLYKS